MRLSAFLLFLAAAPLVAADWPQWRGPNRDGKSADTGLLAAWPEGGPKLVWKLDNVGAGYGQPAVVGDKLFLIGAESTEPEAAEFASCRSVADGKELWRTPLGKSASQFAAGWGGGPRSTPTVTGGKVYTLGASGDLHCLDAASGKVVWQKSLVRDFGGGVPSWGYSESPLVDGDKVVVTPGGRQPAKKGGKGGKAESAPPPKADGKARGGMVALNAATGEPVWVCSELTDPAHYSSVVAADVGGVRVYVQQTGTNAVGVRASDGKLLFHTGELNRNIAVIPTPVVVGDLAFFTAGYGAGSELYKLAADGKGGVTAEKVYTKNKVLVNHHGGVIEHGGFIFGHSDPNGGLNKWVCFDYKTGPDEPVWREDGPRKGSITYADGHFYLYGESNGTVVRIKATKDGYQEAGRFTIPKQSTTRKGTRGLVWPHPVVANGKLYLRDFDLLFVYDLSGKVAGP